MRLILVRHGETSCNTEMIWHGWDECRLTENGQAQARAVAARLASEHVDTIYSSPSRRALETAEAIAASQGLTPILDEGLRERNAGEYEGIAVDDVVARRPTIWEERDADLWNWRPPGGESFTEVRSRLMAVIDRIRQSHRDQTVVIVTHMGATRVLLTMLAGLSLEKTYEMTFPSTGMCIFHLEDERWNLKLLNDARHATVT